MMDRNKVGEDNRESRGAILCREVRKGLEGSEGGRHLDIPEKGLPGSGNSKGKSAEVGGSLVFSRNSKEGQRGWSRVGEGRGMRAVQEPPSL